LNGGLNAWVDQDFETVSCHHDISQAEWKTGNFVAKLLEDYIFSYKQIKQNIIEDNFTVLDARSKKRFEGTAPEPRAHLKSGHISGSLCIPYQSVLIDGKFKSEKELKLIFEQANAKAQQIVFSCGSGMTACIIMLAYELVYPKSRYLYDGSWTEWAELENLKI